LPEGRALKPTAKNLTNKVALYGFRSTFRGAYTGSPARLPNGIGLDLVAVPGRAEVGASIAPPAARV